MSAKAEEIMNIMALKQNSPPRLKAKGDHETHSRARFWISTRAAALDGRIDFITECRKKSDLLKDEEKTSHIIKMMKTVMILKQLK